MPKRMELRVRDGRLEKRCTGCREWIDAEWGFYWRPSRRVRAAPGQMEPRPQCKQCENEASGQRHASYLPQHGFVRYSMVERYLEEAIRRIGQAEFSRRTGIPQPMLWRYRQGTVMRIQRVTAASILSVARQVFRAGEFRTRKEIHYGRSQRLHKQPDSGAATVPE
jgi:hypothetical protein